MRKRVDEITLALRASELTPPGYLDTAFQFPEVERVEIHGFPRASWQPTKIEEAQPGFDAASVESYLLAKHGPGRFRFSAVVGQKSFAWRVYTLGDVRDDAVPTNGNGHGDGTAITGDEALRSIAKHLQANLTAQQLSGMVADLETARTNRELAPVKALTDLVGAVIGKMGAPPPASNDRLTDLLIAELKDLKQELRDVRTAAAGHNGASAAPPPAGHFAEEIRGVFAAAELLGLKPASGPAPAPTLWTPDTVKSMIDAAAPILNRVTDLVQLRLAPGAAAAPAPALPAPGGTTVDKVPLDPAIVEQIAFFLEALRTRDFVTVLWALENLFVGPTGEPLMTIDPDVNPLAYVMKLKPFAPKIDELRGEVAEFLKWVKERREAPPTA